MKSNTGREKANPYVIPVYRLRLVQDGTAEVSPLTGPAEVARYLHNLASSEREQIVALFLDTKNRPIGRHLVSMGTIDSAPAQPRDVFRAALVAGAVNSIILAHNHPSGDVTPSPSDDETTRLIARAGTLLGIRLHLLGDKFRVISQDLAFSDPYFRGCALHYLLLYLFLYL
ncbi:MAG: JAB domain-containing protein [Candidatus Hydrogenedens sp.]|jgi:DNA repair protein RadC|nr:JAB domain-containing protein [Candidatus Hydrogenedens sp.]